MAQSLNVIALISGGKDSLFSLLHCIQNGHRVVALANLYPPSGPSNKTAGDRHVEEVEREGEDLNSFMYQTVGHTLIPLYAEALQLPLYRREIGGKAVDQARDYDYALRSTVDPDETEDLTHLLEEVKSHHPEADAVSSGAILSTYQRTRVESVASRLGLASLSYLWQYPLLPPPPERLDSVTSLLDDMEAAGCDSRIIKIASAGIRESMLFKRVSDPQVRDILLKGMSRFVDLENGRELELRGAVLGEGGEYETIALNGPPRLWKKGISVDERTNRVIRDEGDVCRMVIGESRLFDQAGDSSVETGEKLVRTPALFDAKFQEIKCDLSKEDSYLSNPTLSSSKSVLTWHLPQISQNISESHSTLSVNNLTDSNTSSNIEGQVVTVLSQLDEYLRRHSRTGSTSIHVTFTLILLRKMSDFTAFNSAYSKYFNRVNPPARVTICCGETLPEGVLVSMSAFAVKIDAAQVNGLHVQSISYWAPANIGPYSQAISYPDMSSTGGSWKVVDMAGQIPLVPASMQLYESSFLDQATLSLQNLWRVGQCEKVDWWTHGIAYLSDGDSETIKNRAMTAWEVWRAAHARKPNGTELENMQDEISENEVVDAWDLKHNLKRLHHSTSQTHSSDKYLHTLPNHSVAEIIPFPKPGDDTISPLLAVHVDSLPRSAPVEWHSLGLAGLAECLQTQPPLSCFRETSDSFSLTYSRLRNVEASGSSSDLSSGSADSVSKQPDFTSEFFMIQISSPADASAPDPGNDNLSQSILNSLSRLCSTRSRPSSPSNPSSITSLTAKDFHVTAYLSTERACHALQATGLLENGSGRWPLVIPCHSLWGSQGKSLEMALIGRKDLRMRLGSEG